MLESLDADAAKHELTSFSKPEFSAKTAASWSRFKYVQMLNKNIKWHNPISPFFASPFPSNSPALLWSFLYIVSLYN